MFEIPIVGIELGSSLHDYAMFNCAEFLLRQT